ncbi:MAG: polyprenyl synthetase family protein [Fimbriimonas sp.]|nr:polyprenyl synthetase family protein [Fimbriimonas sp.]
MTATAFLAMGLSHVDPDLLEQITDEVATVEVELLQQVRSQVTLVEKVGRHTLEAGGKRLRPAFVTLSARATGLEFSIDRTRKLGACMEMIHMATLIHDDVIDNATTRRGRTTASAEFGNTAAILSGDVLLSKAMVMLSRDGDLEVIRAISEAAVEIAEGEVRELATRGQFDLDEDTHLEVLRLKTASFIECCLEVGAIVAGAPMEIQHALRDFGFHVGMAFQIVDDILDYRGDQAKTGKLIATDFREGQATLPLIYLRETLSEAESTMVRRKFGNGVNDDEIRMIADWMDIRGAFVRAEQAARDHVAQAILTLERLPETPARVLLETVANQGIRRQA